MGLHRQRSANEQALCAEWRLAGTELPTLLATEPEDAVNNSQTTPVPTQLRLNFSENIIKRSGSIAVVDDSFVGVRCSPLLRCADGCCREEEKSLM